MSGLDPTPLRDQVALVTGAAAGIGHAVALLLGKAGAKLALVDRDSAGLTGIASDLSNHGTEISTHTVDLSRREAVSAVAQEVLERWGRVDILVNCAGIPGPSKGVLEIDLPSWDQVMAINLEAPLLLMQHVGRHMVGRGGGGRIINITSSSAHRARMSQPAYGASKSALMQLSRSAAAEFGSHGITVNSVAPGITETTILTSHFSAEEIGKIVRDGPLSNLVQRVSQPDDIAEAVLFLCMPGSRQITAQTIHVSGGAVI